MNDKRPMSKMEPKLPTPEELDKLVADALLDQLYGEDPVPQGEDGVVDLEAAARSVTPGARGAMANVPNPATLVAEYLAAKQESVLASAKLVGSESTCHGDPDETLNVPGAGLPDMDELTVRSKAVQNAQLMTWVSSFRKLQELGRGGQGVVYLIECIDELSRTNHALKVYFPGPYSSAAEYRKDMQRIHEVSALVHQIHHDNLIDVQRFFEYQGIYVMIMQLIDGFDLRRLLKQKLLGQLQKSIAQDRWKHLDQVVYAKPTDDRVGLQPLVAVNIVEKCLRGLSVLHEEGIVHGDIKPSNIMLDCNGSIRLVDVGSAYSYRSPPEQRIWTPRYAPPEFLDDERWTPQSDLASLGYVLLEMLTGSSDLGGPAIGDDSTTVRDGVRDTALSEAKHCLPQRLPHLVPENVRACGRLMRLCQKLIAPDPKDRFASAAEAIDDAHSDGTWQFRMEMVKVGLAVHEASAIKRWVEDVKSVGPLD